MYIINIKTNKKIKKLFFNISYKHIILIKKIQDKH